MATSALCEPQILKANGSLRPISHKPQNVDSSTHIYDIICVGFSTVGLGLAVALSDLTLDSLTNIVFLERSPCFSSKLESKGQYMQTSFAQDLATLRCPTSPYTFLNYLFGKQDLEAFVSGSSSGKPTREAFEEYLQWAAEQFNDVVMYDEEAMSIEAVTMKGVEALWAVTMRNTRTGDVKHFVSRKVVIAKKCEAQLTTTDFSCGISGGLRQHSRDDIFSELAINSGKVANHLIFEGHGNVKRAAL